MAPIGPAPSSDPFSFDTLHDKDALPISRSNRAIRVDHSGSTPTLRDASPAPRSASIKLHRVSALARHIHGWSWQAFPVGMGTGAVYVALSALKHNSPWVYHLETAFFFLNVALFILNTSTLVLQALLYPHQAWRLIKDPSRSVFVPLMVLSFATVLIGIIIYAVPVKRVSPDGVYVLFWIYVGLALLVSFPMLMIWFNQPHELRMFTPAWAFLIFPMVLSSYHSHDRSSLTSEIQMLVGVVAADVLRVIDPTENRAVGILVVGYFFQGIGFFMTMFYICIYILRIMITGLLTGSQANTAFVACGPPGFTGYALINLGLQAREILPAHNLVSPLAGEVWYAAGVLCGTLLFGFAVFLFVFGILPYFWKLHTHLNEILGCWALTFPNVGWISTLRALGDALDIPAFYVLHEIMATILCLTWLVLFALTLYAFYRGEIFFAKPEDVLRDETHTHVHFHIWRGPPPGHPGAPDAARSV
ncbi:hypothetical protein BV25DRAFT_1920355 [Artomyces pyxidatus]|uniref:Uncharacterized protein n=1 Tax=Artomyces pyxidatus TaxID=48021 RepID=A0ACB8SLF3_9AGAM|nr:hypothetical protein BV25DRAFT_1920355 [Artomyces pyxidatus]